MNRGYLLYRHADLIVVVDGRIIDSMHICIVMYSKYHAVSICCADVLDEERGDVLYNINLLDNEKAAKNVELKKLKPSYNPYTDDEVDEFGVVRY